jgi:hypothetical protein
MDNEKRIDVCKTVRTVNDDEGQRVYICGTEKQQWDRPRGWDYKYCALCGGVMEMTNE